MLKIRSSDLGKCSGPAARPRIPSFSSTLPVWVGKRDGRTPVFVDKLFSRGRRESKKKNDVLVTLLALHLIALSLATSLSPTARRLVISCSGYRRFAPVWSAPMII